MKLNATPVIGRHAYDYEQITRECTALALPQRGENYIMFP
jgi:hypothetical protein